MTGYKRLGGSEGARLVPDLASSAAARALVDAWALRDLGEHRTANPTWTSLTS